MARSIATIFNKIIEAKNADTELSALTSNSASAIWRLMIYIVAVAHNIHEQLFDAHKEEVNAILDVRQTHNLRWYANMAKAFQFGYALPVDSDAYAVVDEATQIVAQASVTEVAGKLVMKVAKLNGENLAPLDTGVNGTSDELTPFKQYVFKRKDAGVVVEVVSAIGDDLRLVVSIMYDPLVLDSYGKLLADTSIEPAKDAIKEFIQTLTFDGEFIPMHLVDALQNTAGCDIVTIESAETKWAANDWMIVNGKVVPNAGYLTIADENLTINYTANV